VNNEVSGMAVSYKKLFKMLIDRDMKKERFQGTDGHKQQYRYETCE